MEVNIKAASAVNVKSSAGLSPYVSQFLGGGGFGQSGYISPAQAMALWELSEAVFTAIDLIASPCQQIDPILKDKKTKEYVTDHPFLDLLNNPGYMQDSGQFIYSLVTSFLVTGAGYPVATGNVNYDPVSVKSIYGNKANLTPDGNNDLLNITFTDTLNGNVYNRQLIPKRKTAVYQASTQLSETIQILRSKRRHGVEASSPLSRVYQQAMSKYYGVVHNSGLLKNGSRPGGVWSPADGPMSQTQHEAFVSEIRNNMSGPINAGKDIIAPRPVKYDTLTITPKDMDFIELINSSNTDIFNTYHIPLPLISAQTMTMSNFENSMISLYDLAVLPTAYFVYKRLGEFLLPRYKDGDRFELTFNEKTLPALKARLLETAKKMRDTASFSDNEIRTETGYESLGTDGDQVYKPANLVPSGQDDDYTGDNINVGDE